MILTYTDDRIAIVEYRAGEVIFREIITHSTDLTRVYVPDISPECPIPIKNNRYINENIPPGMPLALHLCQIRYQRKI